MSKEIVSSKVYPVIFNSALYVFSLSESISRGPGLPGWLYEYSLGADRGVCKWTAEE